MPTGSLNLSGRRPGRRTAALGALSLMLALGGCGVSQDRATSGSGDAQSATAVTSTAASADDDTQPATAASGSATPSGDIIMADPEDFEQLRVDLERLLGHHAMLDVRSARGELNNDPAFVNDAVASLNGNTEDLSEIAEAVGTPSLAEEFEQIWFAHIEDVLAYARAVDDGDEQAAEEARASLTEYEAFFARRLSEVTEGRLPQEQLAAGISAHLDAMLGQIDAYASGTYDTAFELQRDAFRQMSALAAGVAAAFVGAAPGSGDLAPDELLARGPEEELAAQLRILFGEHAALTTDAVRAAIRSTDDFEAATSSLGATTDALTSTVETLFGPEQAQTFKQAWGEHLNLYVDYAVATTEGDEQALQELRDERVPAVMDESAAMFSAATGGQLPAAQLSEAIDGFTEPMLQQIDAYADEDFATANDLAERTYNHLYATAATIAQAFEEAGLIPVGGAQTGAGGLADGDR